MSGKLIIDVKNVRENISKIKSQCKGSLFCGVVKANCYGVGIGLCAHLYDLVDYWAVANTREAKELAKISDKPILVLSPLSYLELSDTDIYKQRNIEYAIDSIDVLKHLIKHKRSISIHIAVNTGMNRYGVDYAIFTKMLHMLSKQRYVLLKGVFSHFYSCRQEDMDNQYKRFIMFADKAKKQYKDVICHISNSAGLAYNLDMVRVGIAMYGTADTDCISLESEVKAVRCVNKGENISYNAHFAAEKDMRVAVIPLGYADGIMRRYGGGCVLINGKACPVVGDICMDCFMVDISLVDDVQVGDCVTIIGKSDKLSVNICQIATKCDTINYEVISRLGSRIERIYKN